MPDPRRLHDFMARTQEHLQDALDRGDKQAVDMYEQFMDRANALGERVLATSGHAPVQAGFGTAPQQQAPPPTGTPTLQPPQAAQQAQQPGQSGKVSVEALFNLQDLNKSGGEKLMLDLNQEVQSPFSLAPRNPVDSVIQRYPTAKPALYTGPTSANPYSATPPPPGGMSAAMSAYAANQGLPNLGYWPETVSPGQDPKPTPAKNFVMEYGLGLRPDELPATPAKQAKAAPQVTASPEVQEPPITGEPTEMPSEFSINPSLQGRYDGIPTMSPEAQAKHAADFSERQEFEKRVEREYGKKPSVIESLLAILLGGARGAGAMSQRGRDYQQGRAAIGREMRGETRSAQQMAYRTEKDKMDRALEMQKMSSMFLPRAAQVAMKPHIVNAERINARIDSIIRNPAYDPAKPDPEIAVLKAQYEEALRQAEDAAAPVTRMLPK